MMVYETIDDRKQAARLWIDAYSEESRKRCSPLHKSPIERALLVLVLTQNISDYLAMHEPQALKQAQQALCGGCSYEDFLV